MLAWIRLAPSENVCFCFRFHSVHIYDCLNHACPHLPPKAHTLLLEEAHLPNFVFLRGVFLFLSSGFTYFADLGPSIKGHNARHILLGSPLFHSPSLAPSSSLITFDTRQDVGLATFPSPSLCTTFPPDPRSSPSACIAVLLLLLRFQFHCFLPSFAQHSVISPLLSPSTSSYLPQSHRFNAPYHELRYPLHGSRILYESDTTTDDYQLRAVSLSILIATDIGFDHLTPAPASLFAESNVSNTCSKAAAKWDSKRSTPTLLRLPSSFHLETGLDPWLFSGYGAPH